MVDSGPRHSRREWVRSCAVAGLLGTTGCLGVLGPDPIPDGPDWPQYKANPQHTGYAGTTGPVDDAVERWQFSTQDSIRSSPVVAGGADGIVFFGNDAGRIYAVDADGGERRWRVDAGDAVRSTPAVVDGTLYVGTAERVLALDAATGDEQWRVPASPAAQNPTVVRDGTVYLTRMGGAFTVGGVSLFDAGSGSREAEIETGSPGGLTAATIDERAIYLGSGGGSLTAYDPQDHGALWSFDVELGFDAAPVVAGDAVYAAAAAGDLHALEATDGGERWSVPASVDRGSPAVVDDAVFLGTTNGTLLALDVADGSERWTLDVGGWVTEAPVATDDAVYVGARDLLAVDRSSGEVLWRSGTDDLVRTSPAVVDGSVFFGTAGGTFHAFGRPS